MIKRFIEGIIIGIISIFIFKGLEKYGGMIIMNTLIKSLFQSFVIELWPIWIGFIIAVTYWFIRFLFNFRRQYMHYKDFSKKTEDDWRKTHQNVLDAWQRISGHGNKIEVLEFRLNKLDENIKEHYKNHELNK